MINLSIFNFEKILIKLEIKKPPKVEKEKGPVAISANNLKRSIITGNKTYGMSLLRADKIEDTSVKDNETYK